MLDTVKVSIVRSELSTAIYKQLSPVRYNDMYRATVATPVGRVAIQTYYEFCKHHGK